ncbi:MAG TPA: ATP-binding protein [Kofleriaceae bacterium]|nr:ATP-binding protein [Kofleriaceae bacterium]
MSDRRSPRGPRTLRGRLALWIAASTALSLLIFAGAAYAVILVTEAEDESTEALHREARTQVLGALALATPIGLALSVTGALLLSRRALAPVDRMLHAAREIGADRIDRRLPVPEQDGELRDLVVGLNSLLDRLEHGYVALSSFTADVSHELRTPLAVIASELEVSLRRSRSPGEWEASARTSLDEIWRLGRLVDALLRLARSAAGAPPASTPIDVENLVAEVVASHASAARAAGLVVELEPGPATVGRLTVRGEPDALASALGNLVANAVRYTPAGGRVAVLLERRAERAAIVVEDSGPGLAPDELDSIFEPFTRGAAGRARDARPGGPAGLGLGLPIARRIATRHGGRLWTEPGASGGARFILELPLAGDETGR